MAGTGDVQADKSDAGGRLTRVLAAMEKWLGVGQKKKLVLGTVVSSARGVIKYKRERLV